jgi:hypothetical protein
MHLPHPFLSIHSSEQALKTQMLHRATKCGTSTTAMVDKIWVNHFTHTVKHLQRFLSLAHRFSPQRLEAACRRALFYSVATDKVVQHILTKGYDRLPLSPYSTIEGQPVFDFNDDTSEDQNSSQCGFPFNS